MTTFESTVAMMRQLPEEDLLVIQSLVRRLVKSPIQPLTEEEFFERLETARRHADEGKLRPASQAIEAMRQRYGL